MTVKERLGFHRYGPMHPMEAGACLAIGMLCYAGWLTHIVACAQDRLWGFLALGAVLVPVGVVHGIGSWFGIW